MTEWAKEGRMLRAPRELKPASTNHLTDMEAANLREPQPAERVGED